jgi:hypothetical protein
LPVSDSLPLAFVVVFPYAESLHEWRLKVNRSTASSQRLSEEDEVGGTDMAVLGPLEGKRGAASNGGNGLVDGKQQSIFGTGVAQILQLVWSRNPAIALVIHNLYHHANATQFF